MIDEKMLVDTFNDIEEFDDCQLIHTDDGKTIRFLYNSTVSVKFFKNEDGFGGKQGGITCSLSVFSPKIRRNIYMKIEQTPNLIQDMKTFLNI